MNGETEHSHLVSTFMNEPKIIVLILFFFDVWRQLESLVCLLSNKNNNIIIGAI